MQQASFQDYQQQYLTTDLAFFELLRSIAELRDHEHTLSDDDLEQLKIGIRVLEGIIKRHVKSL